jgi:type I restriction enzyme S subunit
MKNINLPQKWKIVQIKDIFEIKKGKKVNIIENPSERSVPYIVIGNLRGKPITNFTDDEKGLLCDFNDILIVWDGANCGTVGSGLSGFVGSTIARLRLNDKSINKDYILTFLKSKFKIFNTHTTGATIPHLDKNFLINFKIPVPPLETQKKIVEILENAEKLKEWRAEADELADEYLKSLFLDMFGSPLNNEKEWKKVALSDIAANEKFAIVDGPFGSSLKKDKYIENGIPVIRINNIRNEGFYNDEFKYISEDTYNDLKRSKVTKNDILIARVGNTIGKACLFDQDYKALLSTTGVCKISCDSKKIDYNFLISQMNLDSYQYYIRSQIAGAGQPYLNLTKIKAFEIILPPISLQKEFVTIIKKLKEIKQSQSQSKQEIDNLFNTLMQKAFKGELVC